jgi:hypothetical protein
MKASGERRSNGGPPLNEPWAKKEKSMSRGSSATIEDAASISHRSVANGTLQASTTFRHTRVMSLPRFLL